MRTLSRDIQLTLFVKLTLLFLLWFFCFKHVEKATVSTKQWLLGSGVPMEEGSQQHLDKTQAPSGPMHNKVGFAGIKKSPASQ